MHILPSAPYCMSHICDCLEKKQVFQYICHKIPIISKFSAVGYCKSHISPNDKLSKTTGTRFYAKPSKNNFAFLSSKYEKRKNCNFSYKLGKNGVTIRYGAHITNNAFQTLFDTGYAAYRRHRLDELNTITKFNLSRQSVRTSSLLFALYKNGCLSRLSSHWSREEYSRQVLSISDYATVWHDSSVSASSNGLAVALCNSWRLFSSRYKLRIRRSTDITKFRSFRKRLLNRFLSRHRRHTTLSEVRQFMYRPMYSLGKLYFKNSYHSTGYRAYRSGKAILRAHLGLEKIWHNNAVITDNIRSWMFSFRSDLTVEHAAMLRRLRRIRLGIMNSDVATFTDKTRRVRTRGARRRRLKRRDIYRMARARTLRRRRRICGYSRKKRTRRRFHNRIIRVPWKPFAYKRKLKRKRKFHVIVKKIRFRRRKRIFLKFRYAYKFRMYRFLVCRITSIFLRFLMKHRYVATAELGHASSQCIDRVVSVSRSSLHVYTSLLSSTAHSKLASSISYTNGIACYGILLSILSNNMSRQKVIEWVCGVETPRCAVKHEIAAQVSCTTARRYYWFRTHEPDAFVWNLTTPLISDMQHRVCYKRARNTSRRMLFVYGDKICAVSSATSGTRYYSADVHKQRYASWREHSKLYPASTTPLFFVEYVHLSNFHEKNLLFFSYLVRTRGCYVPVNIGMLDLFMNRSAQLSLSNWCVSSLYSRKRTSPLYNNLHSMLNPYYRGYSSIRSSSLVTGGLFEHLSIASFLYKFLYVRFLTTITDRYRIPSLFSATYAFNYFVLFNNQRCRPALRSALSSSAVFVRFYGSLSDELHDSVRVESRISSMHFYLWLLRKQTFFLITNSLNYVRHIYFFIYFTLMGGAGSLQCVTFFLRLFSISTGMYSMLRDLRNWNIYGVSIQPYLYLYKYETIVLSKLSAGFALFSHRLGIRGMRRYFAYGMLRDLTHRIEHTFRLYLNIYAFFSARFHLTTPPITNAKMVCEYMISKMRLGFNVRNTFISIKAWQQKSHLRKTRFHADFLSMHNFDVRDFMYPLKGIRIACSGPRRKAQQAKTIQYHVWVCDHFYTGRMPLSSFDLDLDYYQSVVVLRRSNIGIKVWLPFDKMETVK